ncbi:ABC transporter ATP-binding protein [Oligoflexus tunisiensis]|uniref:ABC transporter ATP-binding protein n=1 Tax=Oligoflexus tunisiensis TaxID=708132 RepID=UPI00159F1F2C|nr:ABC transporter ATP-binding protein [Oligoflexus tunisiensis]
MLVIHNLSKSYTPVPVLDKVSLELGWGQTLGVLGQNGAGKTTLLRCLTQQIDCTGSLTLDGMPIQEYLETFRKDIAILEDTPFLYPLLSGLEFIRFVLTFKGFSWDEWSPAVQEILKAFDLWDNRYDLCRTYSLGQKKKIYFLAQLVTKPRLIIIDEPTNGLDLQSVVHLRRLLRERVQGGAMLIVSSHHLDFIERMADVIILLKKEGRFALFSSDDVTDLEETFLQETGASMAVP